MRIHRSYQHWILGGCLLVVLSTLLLVGWILESSLREQMVDQIRGSLEQHLILLREVVKDRWNPADPLEHSETLARDLGRELDLRLTLITPDGRVLGDSELPPAEVEALESHATRPEVLAARATGRGSSIRYSSTLQVDLLYVAGLLGDARDPRLVLRLALPLSSVQQALASSRRLVGGAVLLGVLMSLGVAYLVARGINRPVRELTRTAQAITSGKLSRRVRRYPRHEIGELGRAFDAMADSLQAQMEDLTRARDRQEAILKGMVEGVMPVDPQGVILVANQALKDLLGLGIDPVGRVYAEVMRIPDLQEAMREVLSGGTAFASREVRSLTPSPRFLEAHIVRVSGQTPQAGAVAVLHDITGRKRIEQMRRDFVANVSHELRTPLTAIKGSAESLLDGALENPDYARHFVEMVDRHSQRLARLVEDLLSLASIESGESAPNKAPVLAADLADAVLGTVSPLAAHKGVELLRELPREPLTIQADQRQLEQALLNLLDNAIKYTDPGGKVLFSVRGQPGEAVIAVRDTGPGIPREHLPRLFERFYRVDKNRSREQGGTGLGLAIVKHIAQAHGGRVEVHSEVGRGTTFTLTLPA